MRNKSVQAIFIGVALWVAGMTLIGMVGRAPLFARLAVPATAVLAPVAMLALTNLHLRDVSSALRPEVGFRFGVLATLVQFPLDAAGLFAIVNHGFLGLPVASQHAVMLALEVGYFWMLVTPWWISGGPRRLPRGSS